MEEGTSDPLIDVHVDEQAARQLKEATKWTRFISVVGIIGVVLMLLLLLLAGRVFADLLSRWNPAAEDIGKILLIPVILVIALLGLMVSLLYRFSAYTKKGLDLQDQALFNRGLASLKVYFIISGIFSILALLFNFSTLFSI